MDYEQLKKQTNRGWNTWNTLNVLSYGHLPEGFVINLCLRDFKNTGLLRECLIGRNGENEEAIFPGARTYNGGYTQLNLRYADLELDIKTTVVDDEQIILITPLRQGRRTPVLVVEACLMWGKEGTVSKSQGKLCGSFGTRNFEIFTTKPTVEHQNTYSLSPYIAVELDGPVVVSTCPCTLERALMLTNNARAALDAENASFGAHTQAYTAMKTCLAWDTIYESEHDRVCSTVSRIWNKNWGGYVLFDWDTYFAALMASVDNKELAQLNAIAITDEVTESGFIPNFGAANNIKSRDRSQPPVGSYVCLQIYKRWQEKWFCERVYPALLRWNRWFEEHRMTAEGYACWGSDPYQPINDAFWEVECKDSLIGASLESGLDNSPMYDGRGFDADSHTMLLADVGLMGLCIMDCCCLAELARITGHDEDVPELIGRKEKLEKALLTLWDEDFGMFLNKDLRDGSLSRRISPTNFYALWADCVTPAQKQRMSAHFYNPTEFWGDFIIPSIARNDPAFPDQDYWRGRIWAPMNFLVYIAMKNAGMEKECSDLAEKSEALLLQEWQLHGHVHENYSGYDGMGCGVHNSDKFYHWGGLLAYITILQDNNKA